MSQHIGSCVTLVRPSHLVKFLGQVHILQSTHGTVLILHLLKHLGQCSKAQCLSAHFDLHCALTHQYLISQRYQYFLSYNLTQPHCSNPQHCGGSYPTKRCKVFFLWTSNLFQQSQWHQTQHRPSLLLPQRMIFVPRNIIIMKINQTLFHHVIQYYCSCINQV